MMVEPAGRTPVKRVLIADDDPLVCKLVAAALTDAGYIVKVVNDGKAAIQLLKMFSFDLALLDVVMPEKTGFEVVAVIREMPETSLMPVMFLTSRKAEEDRLQGLQLGADDYLAKPFNAEELVLRVGSVLKRSPYISAPKRSSTSVQGLLDDIPLAPLLTMLEIEQKSGLLRVSNGDDKFILYLRDGNVIRTRRNHAGPRDEEAVFEALRWKEGSFQFKAERVGGAVEIEQSTIQLLMEASRRVDEIVS